MPVHPNPAPIMAQHSAYFPGRLTLTIAEVAEIFHVSVATIYSSRSHQAGRATFPDPLVIPGSNRLLWLRDDVISFLESCRTSLANRPIRNRQGAGRPTKMEQVAAAEAGLSVKEWRAARLVKGGAA